MKSDPRPGGQLRNWDGKWYRVVRFVPNQKPGELVAGWVELGEEIHVERSVNS